MARKLATIQKITRLTSIENADNLEVASILGWKVVVRKGEFKEEELCIYCEIDSILPDKPEFEFMRPRKFRIRTIRLRGQISQGIAFPVTLLKDVYDEGSDVTEVLEIEKYLPQIPQCLTGVVKNIFPSFIPKTDETRVQILQNLLDRYVGTKCYITEKVDGSSATYYFKDEFGVCSRNLELLEDDKNSFWKQARENKIEEKLKQALEDTGWHFAIQCELIGQGIQKNNLKIEGNQIPCYNVFNIDRYKYLNYKEFIEFCSKYDILTVPILEDNYLLENNIDNLVEKARGASKLNNKIHREGIVIRPLMEITDLEMSTGMGNARVSFKAINNDYLLKYEE